MTRLAVVLSTLAAAAALPASIASAEPASSPAPGPGEPGSMVPSAIVRGYVRPPPGTPPQVAHGGSVSKIIFVNPCRGGCTFTKTSNGQSDAILNQTWLGSAPLGSTITISEFAHSQEVWDETMACIREVYSPYGVTVVDVDPGEVPHHEAVLAGRPQELPIQGALGVAPLGSGACQPANNVISFSFANAHGPTGNLSLPLHMCWTVAQESAHSYGLEHEFDCSDPLTYLDGCGQKFFRNKQIPCGTFSQEQCLCGGATQNSHARLTAVLGVGTPPPPPVVTISMPADGANVADGFSVFATIVDKRGVKDIELHVNGWKWYRIDGVFGKTSPYVLDIPDAVPDGVLEIDVVGCNDLDVCQTQRVTVTRGEACDDAAADCLFGQRCDAGRCLWDPPTGEVGDACTFNEACTTGLCADIGGSLSCTQNCVGGPNDTCPDGFQCNSGIGVAGVCALPPEEGGCCSTASRGGSRGALALNLGLGLLVGLVAIRRRRRRA